MRPHGRRPRWRSLHVAVSAPAAVEDARPTRGSRRAVTPVESSQRRSRRLASLGLAVLLAAALVALLVAPLFRIHEVTISGNTRLTDAEIMAAADLGKPVSVFVLDASAAEARLARLTWVRSASVSPQLPDRIDVRIEEWQPVALYRPGPGAPYVLSDQAITLGPAVSSDMSGLPEIDGPPQPELKPGKTAIDRRLLTALVNIERSLPGLIGQEVQTFTLDSCGNLTLNARRGWKAQFGRMLTPEEFASLKDKVAALKSLAAAGTVNFESGDLQYVNLMNATLAAVKEKDKPARPARAGPASSPAPSAVAPCR